MVNPSYTAPLSFLMLGATLLCSTQVLAAQSSSRDAINSQTAASSSPREVAEQHVDRCVASHAPGPRRDRCLESTGYSLFDESANEAAWGCIPFCICVVDEGCPCCELGEFGGWIFNPSTKPHANVPTGPTSEAVFLSIESACVETQADGQAVVEIGTQTRSRLAALVEFDVSLPASGIIAATLSDQGRHGDDTPDDGIFSGRARLSEVAADGCFELGCHFGCEGEWVYPEEGEGHCPANDWWGIGCLKLTSCSFGCGSDSDEVDPGFGVRDGTYVLQQPDACGL